MKGLTLTENVKLLLDEIKRDISLAYEEKKRQEIIIETLESRKWDVEKIIDDCANGESDSTK